MKLASDLVGTRGDELAFCMGYDSSGSKSSEECIQACRKSRWWRRTWIEAVREFRRPGLPVLASFMLLLEDLFVFSLCTYIFCKTMSAK